MIGHHTRFRENDDLPLWRGPAVKKSCHFLMCALISREILQGQNIVCIPVKVAYYSFDGLPVRTAQRSCSAASLHLLGCTVLKRP